jgi:hypothetical protein
VDTKALYERGSYNELAFLTPPFWGGFSAEVCER